MRAANGSPAAPYRPGARGASSSRSPTLAPSLVARVSDHLRLTIAPAWTHTVNAWQFVDDGAIAPRPLDILARLRQETLSLTGKMIYAFSPNLSVELYAEPFVSAGRYDAFKMVASPRAPRIDRRVVPIAANQVQYDSASRSYTVGGSGSASATFVDPSFNTKSLNANAVLRWEFLPGSTLFVVWSQQRAVETGDGALDISRAASALFRAPASNTLLVKVSYWMSR